MAGNDPPPFLHAPPHEMSLSMSATDSLLHSDHLPDALASSSPPIDLFAIYSDVSLQSASTISAFSPPQPSHQPSSTFDVSMSDIPASAFASAPHVTTVGFPPAAPPVVISTAVFSPTHGLPPPIPIPHTSASNVLFSDFTSAASIPSVHPPANAVQLSSPLQFSAEAIASLSMHLRSTPPHMLSDQQHSIIRRLDGLYQDDQKKDPQSWLESMFSKITRKAHSALDSCRFGQSKQTRKMAIELKTAILLVSDFLALSINEEEEVTVASIQYDLACLSVPPSPPSRPLDPNGMTVPSQVLDSSRKRTASAMGSSSLASRDRPYSDPTMLKEESDPILIPPAPPNDTGIPPVSSISPTSLPPPTGQPLLSQTQSLPLPEAPLMNVDPSLILSGSGTLPSRPPTPHAFVDNLTGLEARSSSAPHLGGAFANFHYSSQLNPTFLGNRGTSWSDSILGTSSRSLATGPTSFSSDSTPLSTVSPSSLSFTSAAMASPTRVVPSPPNGRSTRSGSLSYPLTSPPAVEAGGSIAGSSPLTAASSAKAVSPSSDDEDDDWDDDQHNQPSSSYDPSGSPVSYHTADLPSEYRAEVDRIFFEYLNSICSNLDATDSKGEAIHQTLMAKKMQRLDESTDFRPFKFRIQAFTHAFLEELSRQGYPDDKIPMKKVRQYLWRQPHILRFNEDGKKAKSKGNHIWNVEGKKLGDGKWDFRPFSRKIAGNPPALAYSGLLWSWAPHIWDPQASFKGVPTQFSSPSLPSWLSWRDNVLVGTPPPDAQSLDITTDAKFVIDNKEGHLTMTFRLNVAPSSRRPSLSSDGRRTTSDSAVHQLSQATSHRPILRSTAPTAPQSHVMQVLNCAVQRVAQERQTQPDDMQDYDDLCKQQHVLVRSATAYSQEGGSLQGELTTTRSVLAKAVETVVYDAAHIVMADKADRALVAGVPSTAAPKVTVNEVSAATQNAVATAVKLNGTSSSEIDIICTASKVLKGQVPPAPASELPFSRSMLPASVNGFPASSHYAPML